MRLIDADALEYRHAYECTGLCIECEYLRGSECGLIMDAPTVDAVTVKRAYSVKTPVLGHFKYCACSNCHANISPQWKVCPACSTIDCVTLLCEDWKE